MVELDLKRTLIWEDAGLLVVNKPPGAASAPLPGLKEPSVQELLVAHLAERGGSEGGLVKRLMPWASGALLWAKTPQSLKELKDQMAEGKARPVFICLVAGRPGGFEGELKNRAGRWVLLKDFSGYSVLEVAPSAGAGEEEAAESLWKTGTPLMGPDGVAPEKGSPFSRRFLHCQRVEFLQPSGGGDRTSVVAPFPPDMKEALARVSRA